MKKPKILKKLEAGVDSWVEILRILNTMTEEERARCIRATATYYGVDL